MASSTHQTAKQVEEKLARQNAKNYGDEEPGGHMASPDSDDDADLPITDTFGPSALDGLGENGFNISDKINEAELKESGIVSEEADKENLRKEKSKLKKAA